MLSSGKVCTNYLSVPIPAGSASPLPVLPELRAEPFSRAPRGGATARCWQRSAGMKRRFGRAAAGGRFPPVTGAFSALFKILGWGLRASFVRKCSPLSYSSRYSFTVTAMLHTCKMWLCLELSYSSAAVWKQLQLGSGLCWGVCSAVRISLLAGFVSTVGAHIPAWGVQVLDTFHWEACDSGSLRKSWSEEGAGLGRWA